MLKRECFHKLLLRHSQGEWNAFSHSFHKQNSFLLAYINISIAQILIMILCFTLVKPWGLARPLACWEEPRMMVSSEGPRPVKASIRPSGESVKHVWQWVKLLAYAQQVEESQLWAWGATIVSQSSEREAWKEKLKSPGLLVRQGPSLRSRKGCDAKPQERRFKSWQPASGIDSGHCRWLGLLEEVRGPRCGEGEVRGYAGTRSQARSNNVQLHTETTYLCPLFLPYASCWSERYDIWAMSLCELPCCNGRSKNMPCVFYL